METNERKDKRRLRMRRKILDAAMLLFVRQGFHNVTLRGVAARIEYSPAAIYRYFKSKGEILSALRAEGFGLFLKRQKLGMTAADPLERLRLAGLEYLRFAKNEPGYFHLMFNLDMDAGDLGGEWVKTPMESFELLRRQVGDCIEAGYFPGHSTQAVVMGLWAATHGMANLLLSGRVEALKGEENAWALMEKTLAFHLRSLGSGRETALGQARAAGSES